MHEGRRKMTVFLLLKDLWRHGIMDLVLGFLLTYDNTHS